MVIKQNLSQIDALIEQAAAVAKFQDSGEQTYADEADRLSKISGVEIGPHGEILPILKASFVKETSFVKEIFTENTGGGCMVDFIKTGDGRVLTLNDEAVCIFESVEDFYQVLCGKPHHSWRGCRTPTIKNC